MVQLLERLGGNLLGHIVVRWHHQVITGTAGEQRRFQDFVTVIDVVDDLDAGFRGEFLQRVLGNVIGPVVNTHFFSGKR